MCDHISWGDGQPSDTSVADLARRFPDSDFPCFPEDLDIYTDAELTL